MVYGTQVSFPLVAQSIRINTLSNNNNNSNQQAKAPVSINASSTSSYIRTLDENSNRSNFESLLQLNFVVNGSRFVVNEAASAYYGSDYLNPVVIESGGRRMYALKSSYPNKQMPVNTVLFNSTFNYSATFEYLNLENFSIVNSETGCIKSVLDFFGFEMPGRDIQTQWLRFLNFTMRNPKCAMFGFAVVDNSKTYLFSQRPVCEKWIVLDADAEHTYLSFTNKFKLESTERTLYYNKRWCFYGKSGRMSPDKIPANSKWVPKQKVKTTYAEALKSESDDEKRIQSVKPFMTVGKVRIEKRSEAKKDKPVKENTVSSSSDEWKYWEPEVNKNYQEIKKDKPAKDDTVDYALRAASDALPSLVFAKTPEPTKTVENNRDKVVDNVRVNKPSNGKSKRKGENNNAKKQRNPKRNQLPEEVNLLNKEAQSFIKKATNVTSTCSCNYGFASLLHDQLASCQVLKQGANISTSRYWFEIKGPKLPKISLPWLARYEPHGKLPALADQLQSAEKYSLIFRPYLIDVNDVSCLKNRDFWFKQIKDRIYVYCLETLAPASWKQISREEFDQLNFSWIMSNNNFAKALSGVSKQIEQQHDREHRKEMEKLNNIPTEERTVSSSSSSESEEETVPPMAKPTVLDYVKKKLSNNDAEKQPLIEKKVEKLSDEEKTKRSGILNRFMRALKAEKSVDDELEELLPHPNLRRNRMSYGSGEKSSSSERIVVKKPVKKFKPLLSSSESDFPDCREFSSTTEFSDGPRAHGSSTESTGDGFFLNRIIMDLVEEEEVLEVNTTSDGVLPNTNLPVREISSGTMMTYDDYLSLDDRVERDSFLFSDDEDESEDSDSDSGSTSEVPDDGFEPYDWRTRITWDAALFEKKYLRWKLWASTTDRMFSAVPRRADDVCPWGPDRDLETREWWLNHFVKFLVEAGYFEQIPRGEDRNYVYAHNIWLKVKSLKPEPITVTWVPTEYEFWAATHKDSIFSKMPFYLAGKLTEKAWKYFGDEASRRKKKEGGDIIKHYLITSKGERVRVKFTKKDLRKLEEGSEDVRPIPLRFGDAVYEHDSVVAHFKTKDSRSTYSRICDHLTIRGKAGVDNRAFLSGKQQKPNRIAKTVLNFWDKVNETSGYLLSKKPIAETMMKIDYSKLWNIMSGQAIAPSLTPESRRAIIERNVTRMTQINVNGLANLENVNQNIDQNTIYVANFISECAIQNSEMKQNLIGLDLSADRKNCLRVGPGYY